jgi:hypothetical protein
MSFAGWLRAAQSEEAAGAQGARRRERRRADRHECIGRKLIIRQRRSLGIIHLRNMSLLGASGITDMPLAINSIVFLELKKKHFYADYVKWTRNLTVGLELARPMNEATMGKLLGSQRPKT